MLLPKQERVQSSIVTESVLLIHLRQHGHHVRRLLRQHVRHVRRHGHREHLLPLIDI